MKTIPFVFNGPDVHLGRFGNIYKGIVLPANPNEARDLMRDKRFTKSQKPFEPYEFTPTEPPKGIDAVETDAQKTARLFANNQREALYENLNRCFEDNENAKD